MFLLTHSVTKLGWRRLVALICAFDDAADDVHYYAVATGFITCPASQPAISPTTIPTRNPMATPRNSLTSRIGRVTTA